MDYIRELNALYHFMLRTKLPKSEFALLTALYMINNAEDWVLWFEADNELLGRLTGGYSREAINKSRNGLKQRGRIDFRPGRRNEEAAKYHIVPFCPKSDVKLDVKLDMKLDMKLDKELDHITKHKQNININTPPVSPGKTFEDFWDAYPDPVRRQTAEDVFRRILSSGCCSADELAAAAQNYAEYIRITGEKRCHPGNFLKNQVYCDFLPENYKKPEPDRKPKAGKYVNRFNQFTQNSYDFDELEKELWSNG